MNCDGLLREKYETCVAPGSYFDMPQHFRVGIGGDPEMTRDRSEAAWAGTGRVAMTSPDQPGWHVESVKFSSSTILRWLPMPRILPSPS